MLRYAFACIHILYERITWCSKAASNTFTLCPTLRLDVMWLCVIIKRAVYGIAVKHTFYGYLQWNMQSTMSDIMSNLEIGQSVGICWFSYSPGTWMKLISLSSYEMFDSTYMFRGQYIWKFLLPWTICNYTLFIWEILYCVQIWNRCGVIKHPNSHYLCTISLNMYSFCHDLWFDQAKSLLSRWHSILSFQQDL